MQRLRVFLCYFLIAGLVFLTGCSVEQDTITAKIFHNVTAHYNGYFYAREKANEVEATIQKSLDDDHNQVLRLFPRLDTALAKKYSKDTEEIIKMASISIQRHPNSNWVDDDYVMVGRARLYSCDFQNAILTFKYVNTKSPSPETRHIALIYLMRTFIEQADFERAEEVFRVLEKEKLSRTNQKNLYLEKAYFYQLKDDYNNMVQNLSKADSLLTRKDHRGRIYFIVGQVYQKLGFNSEAYIFYKKCLATNPDYEIDFYARLNMAQVAKLDNEHDIKMIRRQFAKMLADTKNQEFRDKIYFEFGEFERKQHNLLAAIDDYKLAAHAGKNKRIQGTSYLRVGQISFDSLKKYSIAKLYYDSAVASLPKDFENYEAIKKRQLILGEFAKYTETIALNDSLLTLAAMDTAAVHKRLDSLMANRAKAMAGGKKKKRRGSGGSGGGDNRNQSSSFFNNNGNDPNAADPNAASWYFGNPDQVATGQTEFQRIWGNVTLEDNWRRSNKSALIADTDGTEKKGPDDKAKPAGGGKDTKVAAKKADPVAEFMAKIPRGEEESKRMLAEIEDAYFKLGDLYYFNLNEKDNATGSYEKLLGRFPASKLKPEVLYKLYLIYKEKNSAKADIYAQQLKDEFPTSTFTRILINPDYLKETSVAAEKQKLVYKEAYAYYQKNNLRMAQEKVTQANQLGETGFTPQLDLLKILIDGRTEDVSKYQYELGDFIKKYEDNSLKSYAEMLLASSKKLQEKIEKAKGIQFVKSTDGPHVFVVIYKTSDRIVNAVSNTLDKFDNANWKKQDLTTSNMVLNDTQTLTMVSEFPDKQSAMSYYDKFLAEIATTKPFSQYKFYNFVITKDNFQIFYRTKALDEYLTFFDRNYQK